jgi:hypothetical protein
MNMSDAKLYAINASSFALSMTEIETTLKIILLVASIGYTAHRWYFLTRAKKPD